MSLITLLPCKTLDDFDLRRRDAEADEILSAYTRRAPALLAAAQAIPRWMPAACPPQAERGDVVVVPACCEPLLPDDWFASVEPTGAIVLRGRIAAMQSGPSRWNDRASAPAVDGDLAADFFALGFCRFLLWT